MTPPNPAVFRRASRDYDRHTRLHREAAEALASAAAPFVRTLVRPQGEMIYADLGAGTGAVGRAFARHAAAGTLPKLSLDLNPRPGLPGATRGDLRAIPVRDGALDAAVSGMALHWPQPPEPCYAEIFRVLRPGGALCSAVPVDGSLTEYEALKRVAFPSAPPFRFPTPEETHEHERRAGFTPALERIVDFTEQAANWRALLDAPRGAGGSARGAGPYPGKQALQTFKEAFEASSPEGRILRWRVRLAVSLKR